MIVVHHDASRRQRIELLYGGDVLIVLPVDPQVIRCTETDKKPVSISPTPFAEVLANREIYDVRHAAPEIPQRGDQILDLLLRRIFANSKKHDVVYQLSPPISPPEPITITRQASYNRASTSGRV